MTTYTTITDPQIAPGAPVRSEIATALRDNPLALMEGNGPIKLARAALPAFTAGNISTGVTSSWAGEPGVTAIKKLEHAMPRSGTIRVRMGYRSVTNTQDTWHAVYKNGVIVGAEYNTESSTMAYVNIDVAVEAGDLIQGWVYGEQLSTNAEITFEFMQGLDSLIEISPNQVA